jgi:hypothetical protein
MTDGHIEYGNTQVKTHGTGRRCICGCNLPISNYKEGVLKHTCDNEKNRKKFKVKG